MHYQTTVNVTQNPLKIKYSTNNRRKTRFVFVTLTRFEHNLPSRKMTLMLRMRMNSQTCGILHSVHVHHACLQVINSITLAESVKRRELHHSLTRATSSCKSRPRTLNYKTHSCPFTETSKCRNLTSRRQSRRPGKKENVRMSARPCCLRRGRCCCAT